jgi:hypothetical protein
MEFIAMSDDFRGEKVQGSPESAYLTTGETA